MEEEGVATTQISLIRMHSEKIHPPRALWVPFELGRPLGQPNDAPFQTRVLRACLGLLDADSGPVLQDYPEDVPAEARIESGANPCTMAAAGAPKNMEPKEGTTSQATAPSGSGHRKATAKRGAEAREAIAGTQAYQRRSRVPMRSDNTPPSREPSALATPTPARTRPARESGTS